MSGGVLLQIASKFDAKGIGQAMSGLDKLGKSAAGFALAAGAAFAVATAGAISFVVASGKQLMEIEKLNAQTNAAIKSTGAAAGRTIEQINGLNSSLEKLTGIEAEVIQQGQNMLLTFTNIKGDTFDEATEAALDLSVALGKDMQAAALLVGKALNDPIAGLGALSKAGVQFTDDQKAMITQMVEVNDTAGAQAEILAELNKQFGGSAEAFGDTTAGQLAKIANLFGELGETVAGPFMAVFKDALPVIEDVLQSFMDSPEFAQMLRDAADSLVEMSPALIDLLPDLTEFAIRLIPLMITLIPLLIPLIEFLNDLFKGMAIELEPLTEDVNNFWYGLFVLLSPFGKIIEGITQINKHFGDFGTGLASIFSPLGAVISFFINLEDRIKKVVNGFKEFVQLFTGKPVASGYGNPAFGNMTPSGFGNAAFANMPRFADGGIVTGPTMGLVGEAGPEAIIPLDRMGKMGGGATYNINVQAGVGDPQVIGQQIVAYIKRYEKASGPVFAGA
jgi:hypothetical protein